MFSLQVYGADSAKLFALVRPRCSHRPLLMVIAIELRDAISPELGTELYDVVAHQISLKWHLQPTTTDSNMTLKP